MADVLKGLNGGLIFETLVGNVRCVELTIYGALLTEHGHVLASLLSRLLAWLKKTYEDNNFIKDLGSTAISAELQLSERESALLLGLLKLGLPPEMPFWLS